MIKDVIKSWASATEKTNSINQEGGEIPHGIDEDQDQEDSKALEETVSAIKKTSDESLKAVHKQDDMEAAVAQSAADEKAARTDGNWAQVVSEQRAAAQNQEDKNLAAGRGKSMGR